jgi:SulP family sulfate permease
LPVYSFLARSYAHEAAAILKYLQSGVPLLATLRDYRFAWLSKDSIAGLSACIVSIPSVIAYAELVHLPPIAGLYAALAAAIGYALFSSSRHVIAGPDAAIGLLAGSAILPLAAGDPARIVVLAAVLSILSGVVLLLAARLKLGVIADLLSRPVLIGYLNGASLVLIATQLGKMFGIKTEGEEFFELVLTVIEKAAADASTDLRVWACCWLHCWSDWRAGAAHTRRAGSLCGGDYRHLRLRPRQLRHSAGRHSAVGRAASDDSVVPLGRHRGTCAGRRGDRFPGVFRRHSAGADLCREEWLRGAPEPRTGRPGLGKHSGGVWQGFPVSASQSRTSIVDSAGGMTQVAQLVLAVGLLLFLFFLTGSDRPVAEGRPGGDPDRHRHRHAGDWRRSSRVSTRSTVSSSALPWASPRRY